MGTKVITVRVGKAPRHVDFTVHEGLICKSSAYFRTTLANQLSIAPKERSVILPYQGSHDFQLYMQWLYTGRLHMSKTGETKAATEKTNLMKAYLFGALLEDVDYQDTVMDALRDWIRTANAHDRAVLVEEWVVRIFHRTQATSPLRKFWVDIAVWCLDDKFWEKNKRDLPEEFVQDAAAGLATRVQANKNTVSPFKVTQNERWEHICRYHSHGERLCYRTGRTSE